MFILNIIVCLQTDQHLSMFLNSEIELLVMNAEGSTIRKKC